MTLFDAAYSTLVSNQLFVGGVGTLAFGSLMYVLRTVPQKMLDIVEKTVWTTVSVENMSNEYRDVDAFIEGRRLDFFSRSLEIKDGYLKTGFGGGWGTYDGTLFKYSKTRSVQRLTHIETIDVSFLTRDRSIVERFMKDCRPEEHKNSIYISLYSAGGKRRRPAQTQARAQHRFRRPGDQGSARQTPYVVSRRRRVALIPRHSVEARHHPPRSARNRQDEPDPCARVRFRISTSNISSRFNGLGAAFKSGTKNELFVIEDIDTIAGRLNRVGPKEKDGSNAVEQRAMRGSPLHEVLNSMDGMQTPDGLKFIVTTNHLDRLDPAIVRPGRIDDVIEVGPLSLESARQMFRAFYGRDGIDGYSPRTGAELQQMFSTMTAEDAEAELSHTALNLVPWSGRRQADVARGLGVDP